MPSSMPITRIGICAPRSATKSKPPVPTSGSRLRGAELADLRLERGHPPRREHAGQQAPVDGVDRRVLEDEHARRHLDVGLDQLEDPASARDVGLAVDEAPLDVFVAADRVEVVLLVVVERRLLAQAPEHGVRIGVDLDVVRVVGDGSALVMVTAGFLRCFEERDDRRTGESGSRVTVTPNGAQRVGHRVHDRRRCADGAALAHALVAARARGSASRCARTR